MEEDERSQTRYTPLPLGFHTSVAQGCCARGRIQIDCLLRGFVVVVVVVALPLLLLLLGCEAVGIKLGFHRQRVSLKVEARGTGFVT